MTERHLLQIMVPNHTCYDRKNMTNPKDSETRVTIGDSGTIIMKKCDGWHSYQRRDGKLHHVTLSDTSVIPGVHANLFHVTQAPQKGFQVASEGEALIIKKILLKFALAR